MTLDRVIQIYRRLWKGVSSLFPYFFWPFVVFTTGFILFSGLPIKDILSFLGIFYIIAAMMYGVYRFLKYWNEG